MVLFHDVSNHSEFVFVGRITQWYVQQGALGENRPVMAEGIEAEFPMVGAHAAEPDAAEGQAGIGKMDDGIIDTSAAGRGIGKDFVLLVPA